MSSSCVDSGDEASLRIDRGTYQYMFQDIVSIKTMLLKLKRVLQEVRRMHNPRLYFTSQRNFARRVASCDRPRIRVLHTFVFYARYRDDLSFISRSTFGSHRTHVVRPQSSFRYPMYTVRLCFLPYFINTIFFIFHFCRCPS